MLSRFKQYAFLLYLCLPFCGFKYQCILAQDHVMHTQVFSQADGLSSTQVNIFFEDSRGVVWFGSTYGLNSYNGAQFKSYTKEEDGLGHNYILGITEDNLGNLWVKSGVFSQSSYFLSIYKPETDSFVSVEDYLGTGNSFKGESVTVCDKAQDVNIIVEKYDNTFWFYELKNKNIKFLFSLPFEKDRSLNETRICKTVEGYYRIIMKDVNDKDEWGGKFYEYDLESSRLNKLDIGIYTKIQWSNFDHDFNQIERVEKLDSLLNFFSGSVYELDGISQERFGEAHIFEDKLVVPDREGLKLLHFDLATLNLSTEIACSGESVRKMFRPYHIDSQGGYWMQGEETIIRIHFKRNKFTNLGQKKSGLKIPIRGVAKVNQDLYFAAWNGFHKETNGNYSLHDPYEQIAHANSGSTGIAHDGDVLWIATESAGLLKYTLESNKFRLYPFVDEGVRFSWQPFVDRSGQVWLGADGLFKLQADLGVLIDFKEGDFSSLKGSIVYYFHETDAGTWLCTSKGLYLVNLETETIIKHYSSSQEKSLFLPFDECVHLHQDKNGIFWIATKGNGLVKWNPKTGEYKSFTEANSEVVNNILYAVYEDDMNNLWLPSHYGLMSFDKETEAVRTYYKSDGLAENEFNTISHFQDDQGDLYFGTTDGLVHFTPSDFEHKNFSFPVLLTNASRLNGESEMINILEDIQRNNTLEIEASDRSVELDFTIVNFNKKTADHYSYRIEGFQEDWVYSDNGLVHLDGLTYGKHTLEMRGKPVDSKNWSTYKEGITILVKKPFYLRWWFLLGGLLFLGGLVFYIIRWNTLKYLERQKELEQIVSERTEEIRLQAEELRVLDKVKNNFFANISHELRTPLTLILGPLSYIIDTPERLEEDEVRKQLLVMRRNGSSLLNLVEEILDLSKLEANKLELNEVATNVEEFFEYLFYVFEPQFEAMGIQAKLNNNLDSKLNVLMDRNKMEKVLNNFLSNAIKFTPRGGTITLNLKTDKNKLQIEVVDSGTGIDQADMPYIFDRFFQSKQGDRKLYGGTGIGLALVKEYATLMNAHVFADSEMDKGSTFSFYLPIKEAARIPASELSSPLTLETVEDEVLLSDQEFTILVVEDNLDMREFIIGLLSKNYKTIIKANNGREALRILEEKQTDIDLVVSDVMMPEMDGLELVKIAKLDKRLSTIPFVMLTALAAERDKLAALTIGVDDYLTKPFSVPELLARIHNLLVNASMRKAWWGNFNEELKTVIDKGEGQKEQEQISAEDIHLNQKDKLFIENFKEYIESNPSREALDLESLSKTFLISVRHFNRKVKSITGLTPAKFVREVQLQRARRLLEDDDYMSVSEVAYSVGFFQPSTFTTLFKKRFGVVPSKYRKERK